MTNFAIQTKGPISKAFLDRNVRDFASAAGFISELSYRRNANKDDLTTIFSDNCGTCSTKHAALKQLANENRIGNIKLMMSMFRMNRINTPAIAQVLQEHSLEYIPEAHNYLLAGNVLLDCTKPSFNANNFLDDIIEEMEIETHRINEFKISYHKEFLRKWLKEQPHLNLSFEELWDIREECINALSEKIITKQVI
jgi:hypothetical protein